MPRQPMGTTALDRLRERLDQDARVCSECRYEDAGLGWQAVTTGSSVLYRLVCPSCGAVTTRTLQLGG
ncbi:MAG: HVO_0649 family zinc finger protein [Halobacteriota archaeon]